jgi:hypothetical protein
VSDASELLRDAQYALQNVGHASTDSKKFAAKAKSLARKILRNHPGTREAAGARLILEQLGERLPEPALEFRHMHKTAPEQHQPLTHVETRHEEATAIPQPGWGLRLLQAIPVTGGVFMLTGGIKALAVSENALAVQQLIIGVLLVNFPRTQLFGQLVKLVRSKTSLPGDCYATTDHLPNTQEIADFFRAALQGKKYKLAVIATILFLFNDVLLILAAVLYVLGLRQLLQTIKAWLLH